MQQPDMTFDASYNIFKNSFPQVLSQSLEARAIQYTYSIQDICSSWSKAEHVPVAQGEAVQLACRSTVNVHVQKLDQEPGVARWSPLLSSQALLLCEQPNPHS